VQDCKHWEFMFPTQKHTYVVNSAANRSLSDDDDYTAAAAAAAAAGVGDNKVITHQLHLFTFG